MKVSRIRGDVGGIKMVLDRLNKRLERKGDGSDCTPTDSSQGNSRDLMSVVPASVTRPAASDGANCQYLV